MTHIPNEPISTPELDESGNPKSFTWRRQRLKVARTLDGWRMEEEWWEKQLPRQYWRLLTSDGGVYELARDTAGRWFMYKRYD